MTARRRQYAIFAVCFLFLIVIFPLVYLESLSAAIKHPGFVFSANWTDNFNSSEINEWRLDNTSQTVSSLSLSNSMLDLSINNPIGNGTQISAYRSDLPNTLNGQNYLQVSIRTSSINVAAEISVFESSSDIHVILLKTYNDAQWHTELVFLPYFGVTEPISKIELGMVQLGAFRTGESISFENLSIGNLDL